MTNYRTELQAFVDAAASFTEPALGHHKAWAEALARARVALSVPESSANTACSITPRPELFKQWEDDILNERDNVDYVLDCAWRDGFRAGADQELDACCDSLQELWAPSDWITGLRAKRRPNPPSLKEQALEALTRFSDEVWCEEVHADFDLIQRALEQLDD